MNKDEMIKDIRKDLVSLCVKGTDMCGKIDCHHCHAEALYNAGYRKVAENEIVIKKSELKKIQLELEVRENVWGLEYNDILENYAKQYYELAKQETAREILQNIKKEIDDIGDWQPVYDEMFARIANRHGIELE